MNVEALAVFPFLFGGTFIEGHVGDSAERLRFNFPSFSEGLSLRGQNHITGCHHRSRFPFLFGGTFIEGRAGADAAKQPP